MSAAPQPAPARKPKHKARSVARLAAVQALYQMELGGTGAEAVIREFTDHRFERDLAGTWGGEGEGEGAPLAEADEVFFAEIVRGVVGRQGEIDRAVTKRLATGWRLGRLDATVRALLRSGAYELIARPEIAPEIVIDEYVELAKAFFDGVEPGFVNGALDGVARDVRV